MRKLEIQIFVGSLIGKGRKYENQRAAALAMGVSQSWVSKLINGEFSVDNKNIIPLLLKIGYLPSNPRTYVTDRLISAVAEAWDGSYEDEQQLYDLLVGLGRYKYGRR